MGAIWIAWVGMGGHMSCYGWAWVDIGRCWWLWSGYEYKFERKCWALLCRWATSRSPTWRLRPCCFKSTNPSIFVCLSFFVFPVCFFAYASLLCFPLLSCCCRYYGFLATATKVDNNSPLKRLFESLLFQGPSKWFPLGPSLPPSLCVSCPLPLLFIPPPLLLPLRLLRCQSFVESLALSMTPPT
jgi:hypothetical protein